MRHISLEAIDMATENGKHCSQYQHTPATNCNLWIGDVLDHLRRHIAGLLKTGCAPNAGKTVTIYEIPEFIAHAK